MKRIRITYCTLFFSILFVEVMIALFVRDRFVRPYIGDVLVTVLICCFFRLFILKRTACLPVFVFLFAGLVEIGQYFDLVKLLGLENVQMISVLVGRTFSVADLICYAVGCVLFYITDLLICEREVKNGQSEM